MNILISGLPKTGTTVLFFKIKNSLRGDYNFLFEQFSRDTFKGDLPENFVAKILIDTPYIEKFSSFEEFENEVLLKFDKKILLLRDPRDSLISGLLFFIKEYIVSEEQFYNFIGILRKKEKNPRSYSVRNIQEYYEKIAKENSAGRDANGSEQAAISPQDALIRLLESKKFFCIRYEDMVAGKTEELERYLGFRLEKNTVVTGQFKSVARTKKFGDWKNWFTKEDVKYYKKTLGTFIDKLGYGGDWTLARDPEINPEFSSEYVVGLVNEKRAFQGLGIFSETVDVKAGKNKVAVFAHIFYCDLWDELREYIKNVPIKFDLYVNLVEGNYNNDTVKLIKKDFPFAQIIVSPNRGFDIGGFINQINKTDLSKYDLICKIHTKKSTHKQTALEGENWRRGLLDAVLGSPEIVSEIIKEASLNPKIGMVASEKYFSYDNPSRWAYKVHEKNPLIREESAHYIEICNKLNIPPDIDNLCFVEGTIFWYRAELIQKIKDAGFTIDYFEESTSRVGTKAHAFERAFGNLVKGCMYSFLGINTF